MQGGSSVLERLLRPSEGGLPLDFARQLLQLDFSAEDQARYQELSEKSQLGALNNVEKQELDDLLTANDVLTILQTKAQSSLEQASAG